MDPVKIAGIAEMANAHKEMGTSVVPRVHKLLPQIHKELLEGREGTYPTHRASRLVMGKITGRCLQRVEAPHG